MKVYGRNGCTAPLILNLLGGGEWSASCPGHFRTGEITPGIHRIGAWVGPRTSLDTLNQRKISCSGWEWECYKKVDVHFYLDSTF